MISALTPVIVGYLWVEDWDTFRPNRKILAAGITAIIICVAYRMGITLNKTVESFLIALAPVVAYLVPDPRNQDGPSLGSLRVRLSIGVGPRTRPCMAWASCG